jgi:diadenosine tetraphosphatase ApaH/serine/threonine PP2A family protein phosphatase
VIGTALDIMREVTPPRAVFVDHPVGRPFGPPHDRARNEAVLTRALAELPNFVHCGEIHDPHFQWEPSGSRAWEEDLRNEMLSGHGD